MQKSYDNPILVGFFDYADAGQLLLLGPYNSRKGAHGNAYRRASYAHAGAAHAISASPERVAAHRG
jgi:hypothetical protein